ncbi:hypothetical protein DFP72DRAFT_1102300 [Ephemerocybe angulata]|uniref:Uncharacterized protein n=1 Tax=Ephemerocybe angulata TaxID=980116 RepID=A0A8H6I5R4_9AGAR|nr:hypothetical protein DFP72DRAFT_1102300 [Tulosesus angulatus]
MPMPILPPFLRYAPSYLSMCTNTDTTYAASRAERMRQAWSTIRERLGLRPNPPRSAPTLGSNGTHAPRAVGDSSAPQITDTRELMLAEMARAFNIGLGLNGMKDQVVTGPINIRKLPGGG